MARSVDAKREAVQVSAVGAGAARHLVMTLAQKIGEKELTSGITSFCKDAMEKGFDGACEGLTTPSGGAVAVGVASGAELAVAPWFGVMVCVTLFCGTTLASWRKNKTKEDELRGEFARLAALIEEHGAGTGGPLERFAELFEARGWVEARLAGHEKVVIARMVAEEIEETLRSAGCATEERLATLAAGVNSLQELMLGNLVIGTDTNERVREMQPDVVATRADVSEILAIVRARSEQHLSEAEMRARLEPAIEARVREEYAQTLAEKESQIQRLTAGALRVAHDPALLARLRNNRDGRGLVDALGAAARNAGADLIEILREQAEWAYLIGEIGIAEESLGTILSLRTHDLDARNRLGHIQRLRGDLDAARESYTHVLSEAPDDAWRAIAYGNLGIVADIRGDLDEAERLYRKSLEIEEKLGRLEGMASDYGNLGNIARTRGNLDEAERLYRKSLEIDEQLGLFEGMASDYCNLGNVALMRGNLNEAEQLYRKSLDIEKKLGRLEGMANDYGNLGIVANRRGDKVKARERWEMARDLYAKLGALHKMKEMEERLGTLK